MTSSAQRTGKSYNCFINAQHSSNRVPRVDANANRSLMCKSSKLRDVKLMQTCVPYTWNLYKIILYLKHHINGSSMPSRLKRYMAPKFPQTFPKIIAYIWLNIFRCKNQTRRPPNKTFNSPTTGARACARSTLNRRVRGVCLLLPAVQVTPSIIDSVQSAKMRPWPPNGHNFTA